MNLDNKKIEKLGRTVLHIPARKGSKRVPNKNMRMLNGKPMIGYTFDLARNFNDVFEVFANTDSNEISEYASSMDVKTYKRKPHLATDTASGDEFTIDIINTLKPETLIMLNPVCPLIELDDVTRAIETYIATDGEKDTLISVSESNMQCLFNGEFLNINPEGPLAPSQENEKIEICNWAITIWNAKVFVDNYKKYEGGYCGTNRVLFPLSPLKSIKVSYEDDFRLAESILKTR